VYNQETAGYCSTYYPTNVLISHPTHGGRILDLWMTNEPDFISSLHGCDYDGILYITQYLSFTGTTKSVFVEIQGF